MFMPKYESIADLPRLSDVPEPADVSAFILPPLVWDLELPSHVDQERLVVNMSLLAGLHRVGAIACSGVGGYNGETSQTLPSIVGLNADGSAVAGGLATSKRAEGSRSKQQGYNFNVGFVNTCIGQGIIAHRLNQSEIASQVADLVREKDKSSEAAWSTCLDRALRQAMREGAYGHLMKKGNTADRLSGVACPSLVFLPTAVEASQAIPGIISYGILQTIPTILQAIVKKQYGKLAYFDRRFSIFPWGVQPDRYAMVNALSRVPKLIKHLA
jgi:hypothetical protein